MMLEFIVVKIVCFIGISDHKAHKNAAKLLKI